MQQVVVPLLPVKILLALALAVTVLCVLPLLWWALQRREPRGFPLDEPRDRDASTARPPRDPGDERL